MIVSRDLGSFLPLEPASLHVLGPGDGEGVRVLQFGSQMDEVLRGLVLGPDGSVTLLGIETSFCLGLASRNWSPRNSALSLPLFFHS